MTPPSAASPSPHRPGPRPAPPPHRRPPPYSTGSNTPATSTATAAPGTVGASSSTWPPPRPGSANSFFGPLADELALAWADLTPTERAIDARFLTASIDATNRTRARIADESQPLPYLIVRPYRAPPGNVRVQRPVSSVRVPSVWLSVARSAAATSSQAVVGVAASSAIWVPPCYAERAVPELVDRARLLTGSVAAHEADSAGVQILDHKKTAAQKPPPDDCCSPGTAKAR
jgi:hypothetical protein